MAETAPEAEPLPVSSPRVDDGAVAEEPPKVVEGEEEEPGRHILAHKSAIVKVFAATQAWDLDSPWQALRVENTNGSGVIIAGGLVLTVAHLVANQTFCQIQRCGIPDRHQAKVLYVSHKCDLALLEPDDPSMFADITPLEMGDLPDLRDHVYVCGFPIGGDEISISEGVVSRIEVSVYHHSESWLLCITVDAAINSGNSGGPCIKDGKIVGLAFQGMDSTDNVGEVVPTLVIRHFLEGVRRAEGKGPYQESLPGLGIVTQGLLNPLLRKSLGMGPRESGVLVSKVMYDNSAWGHLEPGDVILEIDGVQIFNNGTVSIRLNPASKHKYRTSFSVVLHTHHIGDQLTFLVRRKRANYAVVELVRLVLGPDRVLVPGPTHDTQPSYFLYCGLLFQPLSKDYLWIWRDWERNAPKELCHLYKSAVPEATRTQVVVLTKILADSVNVGYDEDGEHVAATVDSRVVSCNGVMIRNLQHLVDLIDQTPVEQETLTILTSENVTIALPSPKQRVAEEARERILRVYKIKADRSADLSL